MRPIWIVIGLALAGAGVFGYLKTRGKIDTKDADNKIKEVLEDRIGPVDKVDCPEASRKKGSTFDCTIHFTGGKSYPLTVEITGDDGEWKPHWKGAQILGAEKLAADVTTSYAGKVKNLKVDCGTGVIEIPADGYLCSATDTKGTGHIRVKYDDKTDHVLYNAEP